MGVKLQGRNGEVPEIPLRKRIDDNFLNAEEVEEDPNEDGDEEGPEEVSSWSRPDDAFLRTTFASELALINKTRRLFDKMPYDLIAAKNTPEQEDEGDIPKYTSSFAGIFSKLITCPAFKDRLDFFTYCVKLTIYHRAGEAVQKKPKTSGLRAIRLETFEANFVAAYEGITKKKPKLHKDWNVVFENALKKSFGDDVPPHFKFSSGLSKIRQKLPKGIHASRGRDEQKVGKGDLDAIVTAWGNYATANKLPTIKEAAESFKTPRGPTRGDLPSREETGLELKRDGFSRSVERRQFLMLMVILIWI